MCTIEYEVVASVWRETWISKARKEHRCSTCGIDIAVGARYLNTFSVCEGSPATEAQCEACEAIANRFSDEHGVGKPFPSSLLPFLDECVDYGDEESERWRVAAAEIRARNRLAVSARQTKEVRA